MDGLACYQPTSQRHYKVIVRSPHDCASNHHLYCSPQEQYTRCVGRVLEKLPDRP